MTLTAALKHQNLRQDKISCVTIQNVRYRLVLDITCNTEYVLFAVFEDIKESTFNG